MAGIRLIPLLLLLLASSACAGDDGPAGDVGGAGTGVDADTDADTDADGRPREGSGASGPGSDSSSPADDPAAPGGSDAQPPDDTDGDGSGAEPGSTEAGGRDEGETDTEPEPEADTGRPADAMLSAEEICARVPGERVVAAIGVDAVSAQPRGSEPPQCAYEFETSDGVSTNATIAMLRPTDVGGRDGAAAFRHVVDRNLEAAGDRPVSETPLRVGDEALLLTSETLHLGIVRFGDRIVTTLLRVGTADAEAATSLTRATDALAS